MEQLFILKSVLDRGVKPQAVICDVVPAALGSSGQIANAYQTRLIDSCLGKRSIGSRSDPRVLMEQFLTSMFYIYGYRSYIKEQLTRLLGRVFAPGETGRHVPYYSVFREASPNGWAPSYRVAGEDGLRRSIARRSRSEVSRRDLSGTIPSYECARSLQEFCAQRSIPLLFVWLPVHPIAAQYYRTHLNLSPEECHNAFAAAAELYGGGFLDIHDTDHDPYHFCDFDHLNAAGAIHATERIAQALTASPFDRLLTTGSDTKQ